MQVIKHPSAPESLLIVPRAHLAGIELGKDFVLPLLESVRADTVRCKDMRERPEDYEDFVFVFPAGRRVNEVLPVHQKLLLIFNNLLPSLFRFSYFARAQDGKYLLPEDIMDECIWALSIFIRIMEECSEAVLRAVGHVTPSSPYFQSKYFSNSKIENIHSTLGRVAEAVPYAKAMVDEECSRLEDSWLINPGPFFLYGETLVLSQTNDREAVKMLCRAMLGVDSENWGLKDISQLIRTRVFMSRAFRNIGADKDAKLHETWIINWLGKNPRLVQDKELKYLLLPPGPILDELGGESWLENRKQTAKADQRLTKACKTCSAREPLVASQGSLISSKDCQRAHWKHHNLQNQMPKEIEAMSVTDPEGAKQAADWSLWCSSNHDATQFGMIHALGLHRNPQRGRTHMILKVVEYVPMASKLKHKFRVRACGVFGIKDVLCDIESVMGLNRGEGQEYVDSLFDELDDTWIGPNRDTKVALYRFFVQGRHKHYNPRQSLGPALRP
ncbi:hypothetical protein DFH07DRAFT_962942 [Mycena maculata]|uniref:Uncharacterized protein n=1 Tax=Mycena maculata TaxID=230809 RepID=A0AAD7IMZ2_9AGAR|nr:hypothetical protein DFH07DRAFT_962942 [Mycena maculata]